MGEAIYVLGQGVYGKSLWLPSICCEPYTQKKKKALLKKKEKKYSSSARLPNKPTRRTTMALALWCWTQLDRGRGSKPEA